MPSKGAYLGAYVDPDGRFVSIAQQLAQVSQFEELIGRQLDIDHHFYGWTQQFPTELELGDVEAGRIPLISWHGYRLDEILSGSQDSLIQQRALAVKAFAQPVFIRWAWEMNGFWTISCGAANNSLGTTDGSRKYIRAWRRIHRIFASVGATNVSWVWAPNWSSEPRERWNSWRRYYPGDRYVDWVGIDGFNWGSTQWWSSWHSFATIVSPIYADYGARKPIMVAEVGSTEAGGNKARWIEAARRAMRRRFPGIKAFVYFESRFDGEWSVTSSDGALGAFVRLARDRHFRQP